MDDWADRLLGLKGEAFDTYEEATGEAQSFVGEFGGRVFIGRDDEGIYFVSGIWDDLVIGYVGEED